MKLTKIHTHAYPHQHPHLETSAWSDDLWAGLFWSTILFLGVFAFWTIRALFIRGRKNGFPLPNR